MIISKWENGMKNLLKFILSIISPPLLRKLRSWNFQRSVLPVKFTSHIRRLKPTDLVIDVGANMGLVTECLANTKAKVIAFEPNSKALKELYLVASRYQNVEVLGVAAGTKSKVAKLYLHKDSADSDEDYTQASSLKVEKPNVSSDNYEEVSEIDFARFIVELDRPIELIKIDIEGYEVELINHLLDAGALENVQMVYLETHERKFEALKASTVKLKQRIKDEGLEQKFFYDWH